MSLHFSSRLRAGLFLFCLAIPASAQNAALVGTVRDPQQAAMPGVGVTLTNQDTGVAQTTKTDTSGEYEFPFVKPGNYSVKAEQSGFKTFQQSKFTLAVDQRLRVDIAMQLGETTTIVMVDAAASAVQTESSSLGQIVTRDRIAE